MLLRIAPNRPPKRTSSLLLPAAMPARLLPSFSSAYSLALLLLLTIALLAKQSEQRVLRGGGGRIEEEEGRGGEDIGPEDGAIAEDEGPEVLLPKEEEDASEDGDELLELPSTSFSQRMANAEAKFIATQLAKAAGLEEFLRPRAQRWLLRTETLKNHPMLRSAPSSHHQFAVKRVVSESELNSLLKNAWLGRK